MKGGQIVRFPIGVRAPEAERRHRHADAVGPERIRPHTVPSLLRYVVTGKRPPSTIRTLHDADRIEARCDRPLPLQVDGEDLGDVTEAVFEAERGALRVLA